MIVLSIDSKFNVSVGGTTILPFLNEVYSRRWHFVTRGELSFKIFHFCSKIYPFPRSLVFLDNTELFLFSFSFRPIYTRVLSRNYRSKFFTRAQDFPIKARSLECRKNCFLGEHLIYLISEFLTWAWGLNSGWVLERNAFTNSTR